MNSMAAEATATKAALAAKGDFWQHVTDSLRWRNRWRLVTLEERQGYSVNARTWEAHAEFARGTLPRTRMFHS